MRRRKAAWHGDPSSVVFAILAVAVGPLTRVGALIAVPSGLAGPGAKNTVFADILREASENKRDCDLCDNTQHWLFLLSNGRTGSATILEMVNAIKGFSVASDSGGVFNFLRDSYTEAHDYFSRVSERNLLCALQSFAKNSLLSKQAANKKEEPTVLGWRDTEHTFVSNFTLLRKVFPCAKFIVNTRMNQTEQFASHFLKVPTMQELNRSSSALLNFQRNHKSNAFLIRLGAEVSGGEGFSTNRFNALLHFLGVKGCKYMRVGHANKRGFNTDSFSPYLQGTCRGPRN